MPLTLAQSFPLGRFHATRWNQNPFEDPYGEWPPSPWRLLRALAARWFQYSRETGDQGVELRDRLLSKLAREVPAFNLVDLTCRGVAIKQYQPTAVGWSDAQKKNPGYKRPGSTLVQDHYRAIPPDKPILWMWQLKDDPLDPIELTLLRELLRRTLYFGRAESFCRFEVIEDDFPPSNCVLTSEAGTGNPVLVPLPNSALNLDALLASTDGDPVLQGRGHRVRDLLKQRRIPPGTAWYYATIPGANPVRPAAMALRRYPLNVRILQFAVGGRVYPPVSEWIRITERFRGRTLKNVAMMLTGDRDASFDRLTASDRDRFALLSGKSITGQRLIGHPHAYFVPYPDQFGHPTRLVVFRRTPFEAEEIEAMLKAAEQLLSWQPQGRNWQLRLVSLPGAWCRPQGSTFLRLLHEHGGAQLHSCRPAAEFMFERTAICGPGKHQNAC